MNQVGFLFDASRCVGCHSCRVACQVYNETGPDVNYRQVTAHESGAYPDVVRHMLSLACNHCAEPACIKVCPVGAITKRASDGIVILDEKACIGCRRCLGGCPYGAPRWNPVTLRATKCHFCADRLDVGLPPACVETCLGGALQFGTIEEMEALAQGRPLLRQIEGFASPELTNPSTRFLVR